MKQRNVIILMGNGFDLAHGMKTGFGDFADHYLKNEIILKSVSNIFNEKEPKANFHKLFFGSSFNTNEKKQFCDRFSSYFRNDDIDNLAALIKENNYALLRIFLKNTFLRSLYQKTDKNWFDIENAYFKELVNENSSIYKISKSRPSPTARLEVLNKNFEEVKGAVKAYLGTIEPKWNSQIQSFFEINLQKVDFVYTVNFNYTSTIDYYLEESCNCKTNHIHGTLKGGDIVFGYGNDQDSRYQDMKSSGEDEYLRFFKTFDYLSNPQYDLIYLDALEKFDSYEVFIIGHSLGLTDKTLLSEILDNDKCEKIHLFKRTDLKDDLTALKENFRQQTYAVSRILTNDGTLRKKVVNFEKSAYFP